jgi:putative phosphoribosyl transferase
MSAIGMWYDDFSQTPDAEVGALLERAAASRASVETGRPSASAELPVLDEEVGIDLGPVHLEGHLTIPGGASGVVAFAHGSGSSRHSPRNRYVAAELNRARLGTLLFDLLSTAEELDRANVFDIGLLAGRLDAVSEWLHRQVNVSGARIGYFGASTGAGAALWAAAERGADIGAVVSRGGRPDLAGPRLADVRAPTLLIVGGRDTQVLELNEWARRRLRCETRLAVVPGATHLFEEPGTLEAAADLAREWFATHLASTPQPVR